MVKILDTNVFIRFLTATGEKLYHESKEIMYDIADPEQSPKYGLDPLIIAEVIHVLSKVYKIDKKTIIRSLEAIVMFPGFIGSQKEEILFALEMFRTTSLSFTDSYLIALSEILDYDIISFDTGVKKILKRRKK